MKEYNSFNTILNFPKKLSIFIYIQLFKSTNMFKPLLRTLPSLSGNFTIGCKLNEINRDSLEEFSTYVRVASLLPLQNNYYTNDININLLNGKYEYDVMKFYHIYSNYFYKQNYSYNQSNLKILDISSRYNDYNDNRNKDYEYGCKRINYSLTGYVCNFYAPIYIDNKNELPEYFEICIKFSENIEKKIKVYINKDSRINYLKKYLQLYLNNIDNKVIYCLPESSQATYFGLDIKQGGLVTYVDNVIGHIYNGQTTINNFDNIICEGFERNGIIMRQIIPLSFVFNIEDVLNDYEREFFKNYEIQISGHYCNKNGFRYDFYDFDINYWTKYNKYLKYNEYNGKYSLEHGTAEGNDINVMNVGYPALNESKYIKYAFSNKLTPKYCKFKMMLSSDDDPYITNANFGYSYLQYPNQKYGYFPTLFKDLHSQAVIIEKDLKLPLGNNIQKYYNISSYFSNNITFDYSIFNKYKRIMSNYEFNWFNMFNELSSFNSWSDVQHGYAYHRGILYDLTNPLKNTNIDKFAVFVNYDVNYISEDDLMTSILNGKYVFSKSERSEYPIPTYNGTYDMEIIDDIPLYAYIENLYYRKLININSNNNEAFLHTNRIMKEDYEGSYIKEKKYYNENTYYDIRDIRDIIVSIPGLLNKYKDIYNSLADKYAFQGFLLLDTYSNANLFVTNKDGEKEIILYKDIISTNVINPDYAWLLDSLYMCTSLSSDKVLFKDNYSKVNYDENLYGNVLLFLKNTYIHEYDVIGVILEFIREINGNKTDIYSTFINKLSKINSYINELYGEVNGIAVDNYFILNKNILETDIYIDTYNFNNFVKLYNDFHKTNIYVSSPKYERYIKVVNKTHLDEYYKKLNEDEKNNATINYIEGAIYKEIYVKKRCWVIDNNVMEVKDIYVPLSSYLQDVPGIKPYLELIDELRAKAESSKLVFDLLMSSLSESRESNGKFMFVIKMTDTETIELELDLYIRKDLYKLDDSIMKIVKDNNISISNYVYAYVNDKESTNIDKSEWNILSVSDTLSLNYYIADIDECLTPLFNNVHLNSNDISILNNMIFNNKIHNNKYVFNNGEYFKEINVLETIKEIYKDNQELVDELINANYKDFLDYINSKDDIDINDNDEKLYPHKIEFLKEIHIDLYNRLIDEAGITLYKMENALSVDLDSLDNKLFDYDTSNKIYTFKKDDLTYGFHLINVNITNTNNSFYIKDDYNLNIQFNTINGYDIVNDSEYISNIFYLLLPFIKINVFNEFVKNVSTVIFPYETEIKIQYIVEQLNKNDESKYTMLKENEDDILYKDLVLLQNEKYIKLLRYFNYITPYLKPVTTIKDTYVHKFIENNNEDLNIEKYNILHKQDLSIYEYSPIKVCTGKYDIILNEFDSCYRINQYEHKHFNDNTIYNIPKEIILEERRKYSYDEIQELSQNKAELDEMKRQILFNYFRKYDFDNDNILLFLFNKYDSSYFIEKVNEYESIENTKYRIKYRFNLV